MNIQSLNIDPSIIKEGDNVIFTLSDGSTYSGKITKNTMRDGYYVEIRKHTNSIVFDVLGLSEYDFVRNIVGYPPKGIWPEARTLEDLSKVLHALLKVNKPIEEVIEEKVEEKPSSQ